MPSNSCRFSSPSCQSGAIMIITLIALSLLMLSALALIRSTETSLSMAGNLAFKRDLVNQGERGMARAIALFNTSALDETKRKSPQAAINYSATTLATDTHGIPVSLINSSTFSATMAGADIFDSSANITVRYVIDRLCVPGTVDFSTTNCVALKNNSAKGGSATLAPSKVGQEYLPVYRISVRATGPRNTQTYLQTTITR